MISADCVTSTSLGHCAPGWKDVTYTHKNVLSSFWGPHCCTFFAETEFPLKQIVEYFSKNLCASTDAGNDVMRPIG